MKRTVEFVLMSLVMGACVFAGMRHERARHRCPTHPPPLDLVQATAVCRSHCAPETSAWVAEGNSMSCVCGVIPSLGAFPVSKPQLPPPMAELRRNVPSDAPMLAADEVLTNIE